MPRSIRPAALALAMLAALAPAGTALAQSCTPSEETVLTADDRRRIAGVEASRTRGLAAALVAEADVRRTVSALLGDGLASIETIAPDAYSCRTIKLGGILPAIAYTPFACTVSEGAEGLEIVKTTGSQRLSGTLTPAGDGLFYRGALHYGDETPIPYDRDAGRNQVGCLFGLAGEADAYVLELPQPQFESFHDLLELRPR